MSGIEVTGVVLAVMPLFITALEHYKEGLDPIKAFMGWEKELPHFIRKLRNQHVHFQQTMRLLLEPITSEFELAEMLADPSGDYWKDEKMAARLEEKLQESFHAYQGIIADIERIMKKIANKLDIERAADVSLELMGHSLLDTDVARLPETTLKHCLLLTLNNRIVNSNSRNGSALACPESPSRVS